MSETRIPSQAALILPVLSDCGLGAILLDKNNIVLAVNQTGMELLESTKTAVGRKLPAALLPLQAETMSPIFLRLGFSEYIRQESILHPDWLSPGQRIVVFKDAGDAYLLRMLQEATGKMNEALIICDEEDRIFYCNNSLLRMDSLVVDDVMGQNVGDVYDMADGKECKIPQVRREKRSHLNHRQYYSTKYGKEITTVSNTFPVLEKNRVIGTYNLLEDWSNTGTLHRQIYELQEKLLASQGKQKKGRTPVASAKYHFRDIQYNCDRMRTAVEHCEMAAQTDASVMIYGETGTGKELFAQSIHNESYRAAGPFLAINCAAIPGSLLESVLFGTVKGAFTGAENQAGLFEQADGGTLLLDELNSMDISLQAKLLRVLQEGTVRRVGGDHEIELDVRIIANLNIPPQQAIEEEKLRQDLYYRLATVYVTIPPLRKRGRDIFLLSHNFITLNNRELTKNILDLSLETKTIFMAYQWPGNVRELQHCITHAMSIIPYDAQYITPEYLPEHICRPFLLTDTESSSFDRIVSAAAMSSLFPPSFAGADGKAATGRLYPYDGSVPKSKTAAGNTASGIQGAVGTFEKDTVFQALAASRGNISRAAQMLGISRQSLQYRIRKYRISMEQIRAHLLND